MSPRGAHQQRRLTVLRSISDHFTGDNRPDERVSEMDPALTEPLESLCAQWASCAGDLAESATFGDADREGGCDQES